MKKVRVNLKRPQPLTELSEASSSPFATFSTIVDPTGNLNFEGKASLGADGIQFENGSLYRIKLEDFESLQTLGRGQYGVVQKVIHKPTKVIMALKEIRLELDRSKLNHIIMELEVLHKSSHPNIIDFYGACVVENCVYMSIEYMNAGSLDRLCHGGIPEPVLLKIAESMVTGLEYLKSELKVIHRDVKPTNVLANTFGQIKLCDFGVSGQLVQSVAKTNVGCQPYMAPERITNSAQPYSSRSDVWSLGLSLVEMALAKYPFASVLQESVFAQLNAIVLGETPKFPSTFSEASASFLSQCLNKDPLSRPTYKQLLAHPWIIEGTLMEVDMVAWVTQAMASK